MNRIAAFGRKILIPLSPISPFNGRDSTTVAGGLNRRPLCASVSLW